MDIYDWIKNYDIPIWKTWLAFFIPLDINSSIAASHIFCPLNWSSAAWKGYEFTSQLES